ncbi:unnamed protein product [Somion occarium]|uniref:Seipin n=1 Tax=Somion occarium TaxID=3059160 RepID=A0ABP1CLK9_9APHY
MASREKEKDRLRHDIAHDVGGIASYAWPILRFPIRLFIDLVSSTVRLVKPLAPQLIPLAVFVLAIPILIFLSLSAGWFVWRSIAVGWESPLFLQYGEGPPPYAVIALSNMVAKQPYDISLHLSVPATDSNYALGNFMSTLTLVTPANKTLTSIRRPAIVLPPSWASLSFLYSPSGNIELKIPLLSNFQSSSSNVIARVELGRQDYWKSIGKGEGRELTVSSALLRGVVVNKGLRGIITRFPLLTALVSSGTFLFISFTVLASCLLPAIEWRFHRDVDEGRTENEVAEKPRRRPRQLKTEPLEWNEQPPRRTKGSRRSRSVATPRRSSYDFKMEDTPITMPASSASLPLRHRRSRLSQHSDPDG